MEWNSALNFCGSIRQLEQKIGHQIVKYMVLSGGNTYCSSDETHLSTCQNR